MDRFTRDMLLVGGAGALAVLLGLYSFTSEAGLAVRVVADPALQTAEARLSLEIGSSSWVRHRDEAVCTLIEGRCRAELTRKRIPGGRRGGDHTRGEHRLRLQLATDEGLREYPEIRWRGFAPSLQLDCRASNAVTTGCVVRQGWSAWPP